MTVLALCGAVALAGAAGRGSQLLTIRSASLTQDGQLVVWKLTLAAPFSPAALKAAGRSLCLLLERHDNGTVSGRLCVIGSRAGGSAPRIVYQRVTRAGPGPAAVISATVTRSGA